jgi:hypothetical protein
MTGPIFSYFTFDKQVVSTLESGRCYAIRHADRRNHFVVFSRERISDMAAISTINKLLRKEKHLAEMRVEKLGPGGLIRNQWFDESGNFHTPYENGSERQMLISAVVLTNYSHSMSPIVTLKVITNL